MSTQSSETTLLNTAGLPVVWGSVEGAPSIAALETPEGRAALLDPIHLGRIARSAEIDGPKWEPRAQARADDIRRQAADEMSAYAEDILYEAYRDHEAWTEANPNWEQESREMVLRKRLFEDALTKLLNVEGMKDRIAEAIAWVQRSPATRRLVVLGLDMDGFKSVNDSIGHGAGDEVLADFANHLNAILRKDADIVLSLRLDSAEAARPGGDEFLVLAKIEQDPPPDPDERRRRVSRATVEQKEQKFVEKVGASLTEMLAAKTDELRERFQDHPLIGNMKDLGVSIGVAHWLEGQSAATLLRSADTAMYRIKRARHAATEAAERARQRAEMASERAGLNDRQRDLLILAEALASTIPTLQRVAEWLRRFNSSQDPASDPDAEVAS